MYALIAGFRSAMRSRQFWVAASAVDSPVRIARASSAIVCALADIRWRRGAKRLARGVEIPVGAAQRRCRSCQRFEEGTKAGKIAALGILDGRLEPGLDRHLKVITYLVLCRSQIATGRGVVAAGETVVGTYRLFVLFEWIRTSQREADKDHRDHRSRFRERRRHPRAGGRRRG